MLSLCITKCNNVFIFSKIIININQLESIKYLFLYSNFTISINLSTKD